MLLLITFSCTKEQAVPVDVAFKVEVIDGDYSAPVRVRIDNETTGADAYQWVLEGSSSDTKNTSRNPGSIVYEKGGDYVIKLRASNKDGKVDVMSFPITLYDAVVLDFEVNIVKNNFPPVEVNTINQTRGATSFLWRFENGSPETSNQENPSKVVFSKPGEHKIILKAGTNFESFTAQQTITVKPYLKVGFDWEVAFKDKDHQAPVTLTMQNHSISATSYRWVFEGGEPKTSTQKAPRVTFAQPGLHKITLVATNGKQTKEISKSFQVLANTNLSVFKDIKLGVHAAHENNEIGAFFSAKTREVYTKGELTDEMGKAIDLVFFGLNDAFSYNKFVSPDEVVQETIFTEIPGATHTKIINTLENCACGAAMSVAEFDVMTNDEPLRKLTIEVTNAGSQHFTDEITPRIVLFETADGRKGAIKIKEFVKKGSDSYIILDIKVQKEPI